MSLYTRLESGLNAVPSTEDINYPFRTDRPIRSAFATALRDIYEDYEFARHPDRISWTRLASNYVSPSWKQILRALRTAAADAQSLAEPE